MNTHVARLSHIARQPARRILGLMSGTSLDGLDVALCNCVGSGSNLRLTLENFTTISYPDELKKRLRAISQPTISLEELTVLNAELARIHATMVLDCLAGWHVPTASVDMLASHGQTIWHSPRHQRPDSSYPHHATLQIGDGDHLAALTGIITVADFRQKHVGHGQEGAPLAGYADTLLFSHPDEHRLLLNLGGIANFTYLPATATSGPALATDTGPANTLLDTVTRQHYPGLSYDENGSLAAQGTPHPALLHALLAHPFFAAPLPKTTGPELFGAAYLHAAQVSTHTIDLPATDLLATLAELSAAGVALAAEQCLRDNKRTDVAIYVSGGGIHNAALMAALYRRLPAARFASIDALGIASDAKEAVLFAVLANETIAGNTGFSLGKICLP
jgi:anhydro-N-acetylmuramic acid kinase